MPETAVETKKPAEQNHSEAVATLHDDIKKIIDDRLASVNSDMKSEVKARLEESLVKSVTGFPWVPYLLGGGTSVLATELVDGFLVYRAPTGATAAQIASGTQMNAYMRGGIKIAGAILAGVFLKKVKVYGHDGAMATAVLTFFDGARDIIPFDTWIKDNLVGKIIPPSAGGLGRNQPYTPPVTTRAPAGTVMEF